MMSSAETLNFGPQWLRDLSGGASTSPTSPPAILSQFQQPTSKFKLAENRYGREEMLALFVDDSEIPEELARAPSLVTEIVQAPLAFRPSESNQSQLSSGFRGRGGISTGLRGRSIPGRGRGRGRGTAWVDHDEGPGRKPPLLRRSESEDWRSDSLRGKGDGAEDMIGGLKEWRGSGQRPDFWKDTWRDRPGDVREQKTFRSRSMSAKDSGGDSSKSWNEEKFRDEGFKSSRLLSSESPEGKKEKSSHESSKESPGKDSNTDRGGKNTSNSNVEESSSNKLPQKPSTKQLDPVTEVREVPEVERSKPNDKRVQQSLPLGGINGQVRQAFQQPNEEVYRNFPAKDTGGASSVEENPITASLYQEIQKTTDPFSTSLDTNGINPPISQSIPFSSNSSIGQSPAHQPLPIGHSNKKSSSPIEQLQQLASTWFYKDPQGDIQGPFSSTQMMEWFNAGYFTMVLLIKRACDTEFVPLGELIKTLGQVPFTSPAPPLQKCNNVISERSAYEPNVTAMMQQKFAEQQYIKLQEQQQQSAIGSSRTFQNQQPDVEMILSELMKNQDFRRMSPQHQQQVVLQYAEEIKRQSLSSDVQKNTPFHSTVTTDPSRISQEQQQLNSMRLLGNINVENVQHQSDYLYQQKLMEEKRRKEEEEIKRIQKQQEEQKELLKKQEEEFQRRKEMLIREEEQIKKLQLEAQRKKEELQRKIEEEERLKKIQEMQELERLKKIEEEKQRLREVEEREAERRRIQEEEENRRREEENRKRLEQEEAMRRMEMQKQEEIKRLEIEREERRIQEELRRQEERDRQMAREAEIQRNLEAARIQKEKEEQAKALIKLKQQEKQMQQIQLPKSARWGQGSQIQQSSHSQYDSLSLVEIQKMEKKFEQTRLHEEARIAKETHSYQTPKPKSGWMTNPTQDSGGMSLLDIQREEAKQMVQTQQQFKTKQPEAQKVQSLGYNTSWNKPPKIQPDPPVVKQSAAASSSFWDQVVEENQPKPSPVRQKQTKQQQQSKQSKPKQSKAAKKTKSDEGQQVKAIFQQQITKDSFTEWCESYLERMNAGSIDIPTFVNFLRDVESPYEVQEYVQSYLGESKEVRDFANLFLEQRSNMSGKHNFKTPQSRTSDKSRSSASRDNDGFEMVTGNTKRGKKKVKKSQKVDPSILGFSVNAASDRVNMGEIQTADD
ncbi:GRB10-interacting GYF protein 2-like isoform X2 [Styela clava]